MGSMSSESKNIKDLNRVNKIINEISDLVKSTKKEMTEIEQELIFTKLDLVSEILNNVIERTKNNDYR